MQRSEENRYAIILQYGEMARDYIKEVVKPGILRCAAGCKVSNAWNTRSIPSITCRTSTSSRSRVTKERTSRRVVDVRTVT